MAVSRANQKVISMPPTQEYTELEDISSSHCLICGYEDSNIPVLKKTRATRTIRSLIRFTLQNGWLFIKLKSVGNIVMLSPQKRYPKVSNRRRVWNSRGGWKKYQKIIVRGLEKTESFNSQRGGVAFKLLFISFSNHEIYSIKNVCVCSKSKIKIKVTSKKFCNNSQMLLSSSWAIFIRALVFPSLTRANFSSFEYLCFLLLLIFWFILI